MATFAWVISVARVDAAAAADTCRAKTMTTQTARTTATIPAIRRRVIPAMGRDARSGVIDAVRGVPSAVADGVAPAAFARSSAGGSAWGRRDIGRSVATLSWRVNRGHVTPKLSLSV